MKTFYVDGSFVPENEAVIPVTDLSILRGYGVTDIIRTYKGKAYFLEEHIDRLINSAVETGLTIPWNNQDICKIVVQTIEKNQPVDQANIRLVITGGSSSDYFNPEGTPRLIVLLTELKQLPDDWYKKGVKIVSIYQERDIPDAKTTSYISAALALKKAKELGAVEAVYVNRNSQVLECTTSNLFAFIKGKLVTPKEGILKGITRQAIIRVAEQSFEVIEKPVLLDELIRAEEVFITGTNKGIVPVVEIDEHIIGKGEPGFQTKELIKILEVHTEKVMKQP